MADTWPDAAEAEDALAMLIGFMVNDGRVEQAESFLNRIPEASAERAEAELRTGQAMWRLTCGSMQTDRALVTRERSQLKAARSSTAAGRHRARSSGARSRHHVAGSAGAGADLRRCEPAGQAMALLTDRTAGAADADRQEGSADEGAGFVEQAYKSRPPRSDWFAGRSRRRCAGRRRVRP